jgi:hypothetical protein
MVMVTDQAPRACAHKGIFAIGATCAADEHCADHVGSVYERLYGQPQAFQDGPGFTGDPVERSTDGCTVVINGVPHVPCGYNLKFATGGPQNYPGGRYKEAGPMRICVSLPPLRTLRCQDGEMSGDGRLLGVGTNDRGYDLPK